MGNGTGLEPLGQLNPALRRDIVKDRVSEQVAPIALRSDSVQDLPGSFTQDYVDSY